MRSQLVFGALEQVSNRYRLCKLATKATRRIHRPNTRLQDTINEVLLRVQGVYPEFPHASQMSAELPAEWCGSLTSLREGELESIFPPVQVPGELIVQELAHPAVGG